LYQHRSDLRPRAPEPHSPEPHDASWQRTVWASRHARRLPEDDRPAQVLAHDSLMRPSQTCETAAKTSIGRSHHGRPREIRRRRRAGSSHTGGKPARRIAHQADNWSLPECSAQQRHAECERPLRPMQGHVNHVCGLHHLWRKARRSGKRVVMPLHAVWGEGGVLRRSLNIGAGNGI
jgi:hypothetical protein